MSKKITHCNTDKDSSRGGSGQDSNEMNKKDLEALSGLQQCILSSAMNLIRQIDLYTELKRSLTGDETNTIHAFRDDAITLATAAANEMANPDDDTFDEEDARNGATLMNLLDLRKALRGKN